MHGVALVQRDLFASNCRVIHDGRLRQAPRWMRERGLEWLFRLITEPRRLWRRYLFYNSEFVFNTLLELFGVRKFD